MPATMWFSTNDDLRLAMRVARRVVGVVFAVFAVIGLMVSASTFATGLSTLGWVVFGLAVGCGVGFYALLAAAEYMLRALDEIAHRG